MSLPERNDPMPHIIVKLYPGRSAEQKKLLAREIVKNVREIAICQEKSVSVAFEEVEPDNWAENVYQPDIIDNKEKLVVMPGYNPFQKKEASAGAAKNAEFKIRSYQASDEFAVIDLWHRCNLVVPQNDPQKDIEMKRKVQADLFFVGTINGRIIATVMAGYDGHRGWIYYLAVDPDYRRQQIGRRMVERAESALKERGCPKINLQVRTSNQAVISFYERLGFSNDDVIGLGKKL
jgi:ribosomal protein S18 acetylase RimI-like enzyme/phenylpyruvate tautomerase PptA (4-oxalocrotonate tautomerase family)